MSDRHITVDQFGDGLNAVKSKMSGAISVDNALNANSPNPVQNKVVTTAINALTEMSELTAQTAQFAEQAAQEAQAAAEEAAAKAVSGSKWYTGTAVTGTSRAPEIFSTGIANALVGDIYLNTTTDDIYRCLIPGDASTAGWQWIGNISGTGILRTTVSTEPDPESTANSRRIFFLNEISIPSGRRPKQGDILLTTNGYLYRMLAEDQNDTFSCERLFKIIGEDGVNGSSIWYSSDSTATTSTTTFSLSSIVRFSARPVQVGDFIIANTANPYLYQVTSVTASNANVSYITSLKGADGTAGIGGGSGVFYGVCDTGASYTEKTVTLTDGTGFSLKAGVVVVVKFTNAHRTLDMSLNVEDTGEKPVKGDFNKLNAIYSGSVCSFVYDGANWCSVGFDDQHLYSGVCRTNGDVVEKTVDIPKLTALDPLQRIAVMVYFTNEHTASSMSLKINDNDKDIYPVYIERNINIGPGIIKAGSAHMFVLTSEHYAQVGIYWQLITAPFPTIKAAAGNYINSVGTPTVTASTSGTETTLTFNYLKGEKGDKGDTGAKGDPGSNATVTVDSTLSSSSQNPLRNSTIYNELNKKMDIADPTGTGSLSLNRISGTNVGTNSVAFYGAATGLGALAVGAVVDGNKNPDTGLSYNLAEGKGSQAMGGGNYTKGTYSCTTGSLNSATGNNSFAQGAFTKASGASSVALGYHTTSSGSYSYAEGQYTRSSAYESHAEGANTIASGVASHAQGSATKASHKYGFSAGKATSTGSDIDFVIGCGNVVNSDSAFTIGGSTDINATADASSADPVEDVRAKMTLKNIFRVSKTGNTYGVGSWNSSGADYAEYIKPWFDDNVDNEDRRGYFVTIRNGKLYKAEPGDYIVGITSGNPSVIGNGDEDWLGRWKRDEFNELIYEDIEVDDYEIQTDEDGNPVEVKIGSHIERRTVQVESYDSTQKYIERKDRPEWSCVGMIGVIPLRDDGTCEVGGFAKCGGGGIATKADKWQGHKTFFVIERINDHIISVEMR